jgi:hypothetical protein
MARGATNLLSSLVPSIFAAPLRGAVACTRRLAECNIGTPATSPRRSALRVAWIAHHHLQPQPAKRYRTSNLTEKLATPSPRTPVPHRSIPTPPTPHLHHHLDLPNPPTKHSHHLNTRRIVDEDKSFHHKPPSPQPPPAPYRASRPPTPAAAAPTVAPAKKSSRTSLCPIWTPRR